MRDLEIRGSGNLLGTEQSGYMDSVGFDLYLKMVDEAVEELRHDEFKEIFQDLPKQIERSEPTIDTYFEIGIPRSFMPEQSDRLSYYTALFTVLNAVEIDEVVDELKDRFGKLPGMVSRLIMAATLRFYASTALLERIIIQEKKITIILPKGDREDFYKNKFMGVLTFINSKYSKDIKFVQAKELLKLEMINKFQSPEDSMLFLIKFCKELEELI
jgi:transcription-repair coupling factor (superfamily II helicase)